MSPIQQLDSVLDVIINKHKGSAKLLEISTFMKKKIAHTSVDILIDKLIKDGYVERPYGSGNPLNDTIHRATLEGLIFHQNGGYVNENKIAKIRSRKDEVYTYSVAIGTALAGLYGLFEIAKWIFHHFNWYLRL